MQLAIPARREHLHDERHRAVLGGPSNLDIKLGKEFGPVILDGSRVSGSWYGETMLINQARRTSAGSIDISPIQPIIARVVERWQPLQIWLFGSRSRGDARIDSDWDLLAVVPDCPEPADFDDPMTVWRVKREPGVPSDLFVWRASDFAEDRDVHNTLAYSASREGILVYER